MKKIYVLIILISTFQVNGFAQINSQAKINYKTRLIANKHIDIKTTKRDKLILQEVDNINMQLLVNNNKAIFKEEEVMEMDGKREMIRQISKILTRLTSTYYYDIAEQKIIREQDFDGNLFNISSKFNDITWKLINETKMINDYLCYKAVSIKTFKNRKGKIINLDVIAWYAPKIPIPLGPKNYVGLPGLVLELNEGPNRTYFVDKIELNSKKEITIEGHKKGTELTEEEYTKKTEGTFKSQFIDSNKN
ncbi:GLPGLI family protein [Aureibaculum sp. A20]|uniref:GLPGLI family protein n=1 Tax=Aureibaculum flavum TaxID=2795986 RepID=A0ABS0WW02_9FLAO|nr:GLPGLI family protein [Aureibaculum flavum]MBJ2176175.1 GLPGLI family protein [Aureibaculum flavum]